ncbi:MAG: methyltransferase domain-containing protein [Phycisphaerae bacterium]|nr:methyltransferase domain-containing protein [Phycisphaerae bacterium]
MAYDYRNSHMTRGKGPSYDKEFSENPHRALIWDLEKRCLDRILNHYYRGREIQHLDFACGTGRIISYLEDRASVSVGVDLSLTMLEVAKGKIRSAELIKADITRDDVLGDRLFNLITAFRFFPNAQPSLREDAISLLMKHLTPDGYLVFNNHMNRSSLLQKLLRLRGRTGIRSMRQNEVNRLVAFAGLKIENVFPIGLLPATERRLFLPHLVVRATERAVCCLQVFKSLSQNLIFVCSRNG